MRFINPKIDYAFKKIFGASENREILISFLNALIYEGNPTIEYLEVVDPYLSPPIQGLKDTYLDVKAQLQDGTFVIIEMQVLNVDSFAKRVIYNAAKTYSIQLPAGEGYRMLKPVIALTITDFVIFPERSPYQSHFAFREVSDGYFHPDRELELVFVELPKFSKELEQLETLAEKWIYFLKSARSLTEIPARMSEVPALDRAFQIANLADLTPAELENFERREMFIYDQQGAVMLGRREGREEGRKQEKRAIARKLLDRFEDSEIAEIAGLSVEVVRELRSEAG